MSVLDACRTGDHRLALEAVRDRLASELDTKTGNGVAAVARVLVDVIGTLYRIGGDSAPTLDDELDRRRAEREARENDGRRSGGERRSGGPPRAPTGRRPNQSS